MSDEALFRASEAEGKCQEHERLRSVWARIAAENPERAPIAQIVSDHFAAYAAADRSAEIALRALAESQPACGEEYAYAGASIAFGGTQGLKNRRTTCSRPKGHPSDGPNDGHRGEELT